MTRDNTSKAMAGRLVSLTLGVFLASANAAAAGTESMAEHMKNHAHDAQTDEAVSDNRMPESNETLFLVNGIVCSFCAAGVTKKLSKVDNVDANRFTKGVLVEIEKQRVTVATLPGQALDIQQAYSAIRKGGYEPVSAISRTADGTITRFNDAGESCDADC